MVRSVKRAVLIGVGSLALTLGLIGILVPLLPTTPFVLLATACFVGAWPAMHTRLAESAVFGPMIETGPEGRRLPRRTKIGALAFTLLSIGATVVFVVEAPWLRLLLLAIATGVTILLLRIPTAPRA